MNPQSTLTQPTGVQDLAQQSVAGGRMTVRGSATFRGERVRVGGVTSSGTVEIDGSESLSDLPGFRGDPQLGISSGAVDFADLTRFWLVRTSRMDVIDEHTPLPGLTTRIGDTEFGVTDTCGTVSLDGVRQLQVVWLGDGEPGGPEWVLDGYGCWTSLVERSRVGDVRYVEWKAVWRDITVTVAAVREGTAHIFVTSGGVPEFDAPEVRHTVSLRNAWSAVVPIGELDLRSWRSVEHPVGAGVVAGIVGFVRGRTSVLIQALGGRDELAGITALKNRGETVTPDYVIHPLQANSSQPPIEWRASVDESDITGLRLIESTTVWNGEVTAVRGANDDDDVVYLAHVSATQSETTELISAARPVEADALPSAGLALAGLYMDKG